MSKEAVPELGPEQDWPYLNRTVPCATGNRGAVGNKVSASDLVRHVLPKAHVEVADRSAWRP